MILGGNRNILKKALTVLISTVFSLVLAEALTRVYIFGWDGLKYSKIKNYVNLRDSGILEPVNDSKVLYQLRPSLNTNFRFHSLKTNTAGLRDEDYAFKKPVNTIRIGIVGDSYTMGWGVERGQSYPDRLEEALNRSSRVRFEVINFGVPGYNLESYLGVLTGKALKYKPDLILLGFCEKNDFEQLNSEERLVRLMKNGKNGFFTSYLLAFVKKTIRVQKTTKSEQPYKENAYLKSVFEEFGMVAENAEIPIGLIYLSLNPESSNMQKIKELVNENNLFFIDASIKFKNLNAKDYVVNVLDSHPNEEAHEIFTEMTLKNTKLRDALDNLNKFGDLDSLERKSIDEK